MHVTHTPEQAHTAMAEQWAALRGEWPDPHDQIRQLLMLAHTNADVTTLNQHARQARAAAGELGPERTWRLTGGDTLTLAVGDVVMTRVNDRQQGVLNGERGIVVDVDERGRVRIERREDGPDGPETVRAWVDAGYVERGGVQLAYAITAAKAQGLTAHQTLVYGNGMDAHVLYPAMSRDRHRVDLWLALHPLETDADRARLGTPRIEPEARRRAVDAYAAALENDLPDRLVLTELGEQPAPIVPAEVAARQLRERIAQLGRDVAATNVLIRQATGGGPDPVAAVFDELDTRIAALPDTQLRPPPTDREQLRERLQRAALTVEQRLQADRDRDRAAYTDLRAVAAGEAPSGQITRAQLQQAAIAARAEAVRRATEAALAGASGPVPAGATTGHPSWRDRPYGKIPDAQLPAAIATAEREAARLAATADRQAAQLARLRAAAAAGEGPAMRDLEQRREQLAAQAAAGAQAEQARAAAEAGHAAARQAWQDVRRLEEQKRRNPLALRLAGTSRAQIAAEQEQRRAAALAASDDASRHSSRAYDLERQAGAGGGQRAAAELAELTGQWEQRAEQARTRDAEGLGGGARLMEHGGRSNRQQATAQQQRAAGLRAEAQLRQGLDPILNRLDDVGRQAHAEAKAQRQAEQAARRRAEAQQTQVDDYHLRYGPDIDHGPSLGM